MDVIRLPAGEVIYHEGDRADAIFVIEDGRVEVARLAHTTPLRLAILKKGEIFGESGVLLERPRSTTMTALDEVRLLRLTRAQFLEAFGASDARVLPLLALLARRLEAAGTALTESFEKRPGPACAGELSRLRLVGASPVTEKYIGEEGVAIGQFPFHVGGKMLNDHAPLITADSLSFYATRETALEPRHFAIEIGEGALFVRDLGSEHGTIVNGRHLSRFSEEPLAPVHVGVNEIIAGTSDSPFRFRLVAEPREGA